MKRRGFIAALGGGCCCLVPALAAAQWQAPARFVRPEAASDEGGLWSMMDREETRLRRSPFVLRDRALGEYVQTVACRLTREHCPDIRVHVVNTPLFNAAMAPNGMMQLWTGLLLRVENEAQLAAIMGREKGSEQKHFDFRASMQPDEIVALFEGMLMRDGSRFRFVRLEPAGFGGHRGFRFEFALTRRLDNVELAGLGYGVVSKGELFAIVYMAPRLAFFARQRARVERIAQRARLKD